MKKLTSHVIGTRMAIGNGPKKIPNYAALLQRSGRQIPSASLTKPSAIEVDCGVAPEKIYTGDKMLGTATLHKSNTVPVFSQEEICDIVHMRR